VFAVYFLTQAVTIPIYGRLSDIYGRKRVFVVAAVIFLAGSLLCGFAHNMVALILFRTLQGIGAGGVQPVASTIVGDLYSPAERAKLS
jgi:MFS family permease